jgi:hypothetical protein
MRFRLGIACGIITGSLGWAIPPVRADQIAWDYTWVRNNSVVASNPGSFGAIALLDAPSGHGVGPATILATGLKAFSSAPDSNPDIFSNRLFSLTLRLTDDASGDSGTLTFQGTVTGTLSADRANLTAAMGQPSGQFLSLGGQFYQVSLAVSLPGPPNSGVLGQIQAQVGFSDSAPPPGPTPQPPPIMQPVPPSTAFASPEPATLVSAGLGLFVCAWVSRLLRRRGEAG